jgi:putative Holliday junction resolvase
MRALGIDHGKKRVGVAVAAEGGRLALPLEVVPGKDRHQLLSRLQELVAAHQIQTVVVGHPLTMQGDSGQQARQAEDFAHRLQHKLGDAVNVLLWDERLTSVQVDRARPGAASSKDGTRDLMAAVLILQTYLDSQRLG